MEEGGGKQERWSGVDVLSSSHRELRLQDQDVLPNLVRTMGHQGM